MASYAARESWILLLARPWMRIQEEWLSAELASIVERQENEYDQIRCPTSGPH